MVKKDTIFETSTIRYEGIFSFSDLYKNCHDYVMNEIEPNDFEEPVYNEKNPSAGKLIDITWNFKKKFTGYMRFDGKVTFRAVNMIKVEVEEKGKKVKKNKGIIQVKITGLLVHDYQNKFESSEFLGKLRDIYDKWVIKSRIDRFEDKVTAFCEGLSEVAKDSLKIK